MVTILTAAFIIANLIVAVVTTNLELVTKELKVSVHKLNINYDYFEPLAFRFL